MTDRSSDIGKDNTIKQRTKSNVSITWEDGPINDAKYRAHDADQVGLQACFYGQIYGDSDYVQSSDTKLSKDIGMLMWNASDDTTFEQLGWRDGADAWEHQETFSNLNGHSGIGCYTWDPGSISYVIFVSYDRL